MTGANDIMGAIERKATAGKVAIFIVQLAIGLSFLYPLYFMLMNSLKTRSAYYTDPFALPAAPLQFANFAAMVSQFKIFQLFRNSFIICLVTLVFLLVLGVLASYSFAKLRFRWTQPVYLCIIATLFIPAQVTMIPMYVLFAKFSLVNTYWAVSLAYIAQFIPEVIMLMTANFRSIPNEIIEASEIDGCNYWDVVRNVIAPMGRSAIFLTIIFYFILMWNDLFIPMVLLQKMDMRTVMVALASLIARYTGDPPYQFAGLLLSAIPALLVYVVFQQYIIKGLTAGAIK
jgi:ABC-type glycerol-3-phosphate transport system permease component